MVFCAPLSRYAWRHCPLSTALILIYVSISSHFSFLFLPTPSFPFPPFSPLTFLLILPLFFLSVPSPAPPPFPTLSIPFTLSSLSFPFTVTYFVLSVAHPPPSLYIYFSLFRVRVRLVCLSLFTPLRQRQPVIRVAWDIITSDGALQIRCFPSLSLILRFDLSAANVGRLRRRTSSQWRRSRGGARGAIVPPIKIYLGESIFSPPQSFRWTAKKLHQECTTNRHLEIQNPKYFLGTGPCPFPRPLPQWTTPPERLDRPLKIYLDWRRCIFPPGR